MLVAYAAAHEVGHLLLGSNAHTINGVMKGNWDAKDMQAMFQNAVHFNREQQRFIANYCGAFTAGGVVIAHDLHEPSRCHLYGAAD
jgi:hypothetical protein